MIENNDQVGLEIAVKGRSGIYMAEPVSNRKATVETAQLLRWMRALTDKRNTITLATTKRVSERATITVALKIDFSTLTASRNICLMPNLLRYCTNSLTVKKFCQSKITNQPRARPSQPRATENTRPRSLFTVTVGVQIDKAALTHICQTIN